MATKIRAKLESGLTAVWLKWDPPVHQLRSNLLSMSEGQSTGSKGQDTHLRVITTEPVSLEMFNKAAMDLETKGVINLKKYTKYLTKKISEPV